MRAVEFALDLTRSPLHYAGTTRPVMVFGKDEQETSAGGHPVWDIDVLFQVPQFGGEVKTETISVRTPAPKRPELAQFQPVMFEHPVVSAYIKGGDMRVTVKAAGIAGTSAGGRKVAEAA